jgi:shikimate dehydrogenase
MVEVAQKAFVCGHPIAHSRSPKIHGYWLQKYGIAGSYEAIDVASEAVAGFFATLKEKGFAGGNVTIPHKEAAFAAAVRRDEAAEKIGAVNTLWFENGVLCGGNTDVAGFAANLDERAPGWTKAGAAVVLGAGGAARAVIYALKERGFADIRVTNRTTARAEELADRFGPGVTAYPVAATNELLADAGLLVNTTALGMAGKAGADELPANPEMLPRHAIVTDIVYVPLETPLIAAARRRGLKTVDGLGMLLHQAVPGFERWFGRRPEVTQELRDMIIADMAGAAEAKRP